MRFDAITLFPQMFETLSQFGVTRRAHERGLWQLRTWNPRDFTLDVHRTVDDRPFGGGPGMVLMAEPLACAVEAARADACDPGALPSVAPPWVICLSAAGRPLTDARVKQLAGEATRGRGLILVCGRYEGIDQRFIDALVDEEVSIGDFVLSGGEIAAMSLIDAVVRQPVLLSGDHARIEQWRRDHSLERTRRVRPDLLQDDAQDNAEMHLPYEA